jgi:8-oxo-dGTP pyrophosphatase MutT (NUDIX family)
VDRNEETRRWAIHGERVVDSSRRLALSIADIELPDGTRFEQYVLRVPRSVMVVIVDADDRVLLIWRHRFIIDRWVWEIPGGYIEPGEDPEDAAIREVVEETGWRPSTVEHVVTLQPMVGSADAENIVYVARGEVKDTGLGGDINEAELVSWIPLAEIPALIRDGKIVGAGSVVGLLSVITGWKPQ